MPFAIHKGVRIHWEEHGAATNPPVLLIMGLTFALDMWHRVLPVVSRRYRTIAFDNRGVGRSDSPRGPYWMKVMSEDALAVLDAAGVERAHVMGASMGGMIAQELALGHPERVQSLMLGCTSCGGLRSKWPDLRRVPRFGPGSRLSPMERTLALEPLLYAPATPRRRIEEDTAVRLRSYPDERVYWKQLAGILAWSSYRRLPQIRTPTLILHGDCDRLVPPENARIIASRIPGARLVMVPGAGHIFSTDQPEFSMHVTLEFLREQVAELVG